MKNIRLVTKITNARTNISNKRMILGYPKMFLKLETFTKTVN